MNIKPIKPTFHKKLSNFIERSPRVQSILLMVDKNPALFSATYTAILATTIKPLSILGISVKTDVGKKDAKYASAKSISTGILDFLIALSIFAPLNKRLDKISKNLINKKNTIYFNNRELCDNYKSVMNRFIKISALPIFAFCKYAILEPSVRIIFGNKNSENKK